MNTVLYKAISFVLSLLMALIQQLLPYSIEKGLIWEDGNTVVYSGSSGVYYPRLCALSDGSLLCGFTCRDGAQRFYIRVMRSTDDGVTWNTCTESGSCYMQYDCDNANFLQLDNGDILLSYRAVLTDSDGTYSSLRTSISTDNGATWRDHSLICEYNNTLFKGVWEPHLGYIGDKIAVFYANDSLTGAVNEDWQQNIEYRLFENGAWSEAHIVSSGIKTGSRDGMPVWCCLNDGSYALAVEGTRSMGKNEIKNGFFIKLMISENGLDWDETKAINVYYPEDSSRCAAAPYIVCLPDGRVAISFQTDEDCAVQGDLPAGKGYKMKIVVSDRPVNRYSRNISFSDSVTPFDIPDDKCAIWNSMLVVNGSLYAVSSTNYQSNSVIIKKAAVK